MKLHLYSLKNRLSGIFERPVAEIYDPQQYSESLTQSLALADVEILTRYKEYDVYCLGIMDSKTGDIKSNVDFVITLDGICEHYIAVKAKKVDENVREEGQSA